MAAARPDYYKVLGVGKNASDEEVKKADEALKNGAKLQDYYATIVASGKKSI